MNAEVISIGDELTSGQRLDTNSQWLSQQLLDLGIRVLYHSTVGDDLAANQLVFRQAIERAEVVVATGGLGPTADDLTREVLAEVAGTDLVLDEPSLAHIQALFARRQRPMPERNKVQAMFPRGARVIPNPHGSAPGIDLEFPRPGRTSCRLFALPGVPAEMKEMWSATVAPALRQQTGNLRLIRHHVIRCFGVGESDLEAMLPDIIRRGREPEVGITVSQATLSLRIRAEGESEEACERMMAPTVDTIRQCLGNLVFGEGEDELQHAVARLLKRRKQTLAIAECGPAGMMTHWMTEADGAGGVFLGGIVGLSPARVLNAWKFSAAGAEPQLVSTMAERVRSELGADFGLAIGAFPTADERVQPVHFCVATPVGSFPSSLPFTGHPDVRPSRMAKHALNLLRLWLLENP